MATENLLEQKYKEGKLKNDKPFEYARKLTDQAIRKGYTKKKIVDSTKLKETASMPRLDETSTSSEEDADILIPKKRKRSATSTCTRSKPNHDGSDEKLREDDGESNAKKPKKTNSDDDKSEIGNQLEENTNDNQSTESAEELPDLTRDIHKNKDNESTESATEDMNTQLIDEAVCVQETKPNHVEKNESDVQTELKNEDENMNNQLSDNAEVCVEETKPNHVEENESDLQTELKTGVNRETDKISDQTEFITDEVNEMNHEGDTTIEYLPELSESVVENENQSKASDVLNIKKESVKHEPGKEANHVVEVKEEIGKEANHVVEVKEEIGKEANHVVEVKKEVKKEFVKTELKEESVKKEVKEECVKTELKEETKCGVSNGTDDEEVNEEQDQQGSNI